MFESFLVSRVFWYFFMEEFVFCHAHELSFDIDLIFPNSQKNDSI